MVLAKSSKKSEGSTAKIILRSLRADLRPDQHILSSAPSLTKPTYLHMLTPYVEIVMPRRNEDLPAPFVNSRLNKPLTRSRRCLIAQTSPRQPAATRVTSTKYLWRVCRVGRTSIYQVDGILR